MWLFAGLGNPGDEYSRNRHNAGFMAVDAVASAGSFPEFRAKYQGLITQGMASGEKIILLKPQTYMNLSGQSVGALARFFKIEPANIVVFHDELDILPGDVRVKKGGGNAGHNGLQSIQDHLGTPDFWRVRIGIGRPADKSMVSDYVLHDFAKTDTVWLGSLLEKMGKNFAMIVTEGVEAFVRGLALD